MKPKAVSPEEAFAEFLENRDVLLLLAPYWTHGKFHVSINRHSETARSTRIFSVAISGTQEYLNGRLVTRTARGEGMTFENAVRHAVAKAEEKFKGFPLPPRGG